MIQTDRSITRPIRSRRAIAILVLTALTIVAVSAEDPRADPEPIEIDGEAAALAAERDGGEVFRMRWKLAGFFGALVGLFVPSSGDGLLTFVPQSEERVRIQFLINAPRREGEYFLYGAEIDERTGATTRVWSSYRFRGEGEQKGETVEAENVIELASAIHRLRHDPPRSLQRMTIWTGGRTYPVEIEPTGPDTRKISGRKTAVRGYAVRGVEIEGKRAFEDKYFLYFTRDARGVPVEIVGKRGLIRVRFQLVRRSGPPG